MRKPKEELHILVVDDQVEGRETATEFLQHLGYRKFTVVDDGNEAISALEKDSSIDLVLSDWDMPIMSGLALLKRVRANPRWEHIPFIMMTAPKSIEPEKLSLAVEGLVDDYLVKPFRLQVLDEKLQKVLSKSVHGPQKTVVVVDDEEDARETIVEYLQRYGFRKISTFVDGAAAFEFIQDHPNDIGMIIADWEMPRMKGVELLSHCRALDVVKDIPFFIVTSQASTERMKVMVAAQLHVDQYLLKPFTKDDLQARIEETLEKARVAREVKLLVEEGFQALEHARTKAAQACFDKALQLDPDYDNSLAGIGEVQWKTKGPAAAVPYYHRAVTLNPLRETHYLNLARAYRDLEQFGKAIHALQMGQTNIPLSTNFSFELARIYLEKKMPRKAFEELTLVIQAHPENKEAESLLALAKKEMEEKAQKS